MNVVEILLQIIFGCGIVLLAVGLPVAYMISDRMEQMGTGKKVWQRSIEEAESLGNIVRIGFDQFKHYHSINPDAYELDYLGYDGLVRYLDQFDKYFIVFKTYEDFRKYKSFRREQQRLAELKREEGKRVAENANTARYYQSVLRDIDRLREQAKEEAEEAKRLALNATKIPVDQNGSVSAVWTMTDCPINKTAWSLLLTPNE